MKSNADKCKNQKWKFKIGSHEIANTKCEKLLGVFLDSGLYLIIYQKFTKKQVVKFSR